METGPEQKQFLDSKVFNDLKINLSGHKSNDGIPLFDDNAEFLRDEIQRLCEKKHNVENYKFLEEIYDLNTNPHLTEQERQRKIDTLYDKFIQGKKNSPAQKSALQDDELTLNVPEQKDARRFMRLKSLFKSTELNISHELVEALRSRKHARSLTLGDFAATSAAQSVIAETFKLLQESLDPKDYRLRLAELYARLARYEQMEPPIKTKKPSGFWAWFFRDTSSDYVNLFLQSQMVVSKIQREIVYYFLAPGFESKDKMSERVLAEGLDKTLKNGLKTLQDISRKMREFESKHGSEKMYSENLEELKISIAGILALTKPVTEKTLTSLRA